MPVPIEEVYMLLGEKVVIIHDKDKTIRRLEAEIKLKEEYIQQLEQSKTEDNG